MRGVGTMLDLPDLALDLALGGTFMLREPKILELSRLVALDDALLLARFPEREEALEALLRGFDDAFELLEEWRLLTGVEVDERTLLIQPFTASRVLI